VFKFLRCGLFLCLAVAGCGPVTRATLHRDDMVKVFPWPGNKDKVVVRVKPQTTMANACVWLGSYEDAEVTPEVTFYITDQTNQHFAYTPARSPMRRLAPVKTIEIRWPIRKAEPVSSGESSPPAEQAPPSPSKPTSGSPPSNPPESGQP
jgi:hypothetical protein